MNEIDKKLFEYLPTDRTRFEPDGGGYEFEEVPDEPTLTDFHKWMNYNSIYWNQDSDYIYINPQENECIWLIRWYEYEIRFPSNLPLMQQSDTTKETILKLILGEYGNNHTH